MSECNMEITGELVEVGQLQDEGGAHGLLLARGDQTFITIKGLTKDEIRAIGSNRLYTPLTISVATLQQTSVALDQQSLLRAVNTIARQLIDEQAAAPVDADEDDFAAGKMAGTVQFAAEIIKHIQLASASTTTERSVGE